MSVLQQSVNTGNIGSLCAINMLCGVMFNLRKNELAAEAAGSSSTCFEIGRHGILINLTFLHPKCGVSSAMLVGSMGR